MNISVKTLITGDRYVPEGPNIWTSFSQYCFQFEVEGVSKAVTEGGGSAGRPPAGRFPAVI